MSERFCKWCGKSFQHKGKGATQYCSQQCRSEANNKKSLNIEREGKKKRKRVSKNDPNAELCKMAVEALKRNMSYGEYSPIYDAEKQKGAI